MQEKFQNRFWSKWFLYNGFELHVRGVTQFFKPLQRTISELAHRNYWLYVKYAVVMDISYANLLFERIE